MGPFHLTDLDCFCHRNFKTARCWSALSSEVKTFLETVLIQSKRWMFIIVSVILSHKFHSRKRASENRLLDCWSPRNVGECFSVLIHELVQKFHYFLFLLSVFFTVLRLPRTEQGHQTSILGKYLFGRRSDCDLRSRIFGTCVVKFVGCLLLLGFLNV